MFLRINLLAPLVWLALAACACGAQARSDDLHPGLQALIRRGRGPARAEAPAPTADAFVAPDLAWFGPAGQPASELAPPGPTEVEWRGFIKADFRSYDYFQARFRGHLRLEINQAVALDQSSGGERPARTQVIRLNRGANSLRALFDPPPYGDAFLQIEWGEANQPSGPISPRLFRHAPDPSLARFDRIRRGFEWFAEYRCARCHSPVSSATLDLQRDAPDLTNIGDRRRSGWLARWIWQPRSLRLDARMPALLRGPDGEKEARAIAAFLSGRRSAGRPARGETSPELVSAGKALFQKLQCRACHLDPSEHAVSGGAEVSRIQLRASAPVGAGEAPAAPRRLSLKNVRQKFLPGALAEFLEKPEANYRWIQMPNFGLSAAEAKALAAYLLSAADSTLLPDPELSEAADGERLIETAGCLQCHLLSMPNHYAAKPLTAIIQRVERGCLAEDSRMPEKTPRFDLTPEERECLREFLRSDLAPLNRDLPRDFAARQTARLQCQQCHGAIEGIPRWDGLGAKLKPEWVAKFIAGEIREKPRPWLEARMPAFPAWSEEIARGMAEQAGYPPRAAPEGPVNSTLAAIGKKLVSADGGFSCVACHAIGKSHAGQVMESPGINFAWVSARLQKAYFERWVRNPLKIDPNAKMPVFFDDAGRSPLSDILGGDGGQQIEAIWQYLRTIGSRD